MQHRLRLATFTHAPEALDLEGRNARIAASPSTQRIAVCTTRQFIHLYRPQPSSKPACLPPCLQHLLQSIRPADLVLTHSISISQHSIPTAIAAGAHSRVLPMYPPRLRRSGVQRRFHHGHSCCGCAAGAHGVTLSLQAGGALQLTWTGHVRSAPKLCPPPPVASSSVSSAGPPDAAAAAAPHITHIIAHPDCADASVVYSDGSAAHCICDSSAQSPLMHAVHARWLMEPGSGALCGAIGARARSIALGCEDGVTRVWAADGAGGEAEPRELSLADWGHGVESTGAVECVVWTPDSEVRPPQPTTG